MLEPGTRLGPYAVVSPLGSGGMGEVYRAEDTRLRRVVAIKTLSSRLESSAQAIERFEREARAAASLNHPNICTIYDVGTNPPFIAMELLEGETLQQRLTRGPLDVPATLDVMLGLVDALDAAHAKGILHRDIKPANIFLSTLERASSEASDVVAAGPLVGEDLAWAGDTLLYAVLSPVNNTPAIWALRRGDSNPRELIENAYSPAATPDGQTVVFSRVEHSRRGIWRADSEGRGAVEVGASAANRVTVTPDGKQAIFLSLESGVQAPWTVPLDGGKPTQLANVYAFQPVPSPDGTSLAFVSLDEQRRSIIAICALADCSSRRTLPLPRRPAALQWTPDGRGLAFATRSNIWVQPIDGSAAYQLTRFPEDDRRIEDFEWSRDGRRLAFSRSRRTWDIVLFRGLRLD